MDARAWAGLGIGLAAGIGAVALARRGRSGDASPELVRSRGKWHLMDGEAQHRRHPATFEIPSARVRRGLRVGDLAKLCFVNDARGPSERMWVEVTRRLSNDRYVGTLRNRPSAIEGLRRGDAVSFGQRHVIAT